MAAGENITIYPEDKVETFPDPSLGLGSKIIIYRATPVLVIDAKKTNTYRTWTTTILDLLKEKNIDLLGQDSVTPDQSTQISYAMQINVTRVAEVEIKEIQPIAFKTTKKTSVDLEKGQIKIEQKGVNGEKQVTYTVKRVDGEEVSRTATDTVTTKEPVNEIQTIGIGPKLAKSGPYVDTINSAAKKYLVNGTALMCLMLKESNGHADSVNDSGPYYGLFQYSDGFWATASSGAGYGGSSWSNPTAQIYATAWAVTHGYGGRWGGTWPSCSGK